jgi:hypothetical protein
MRLSDLSRRHKILLGLAALFALIGALTAFLTAPLSPASPPKRPSNRSRPGMWTEPVPM